jgi:hypothetical protein
MIIDAMPRRSSMRTSRSCRSSGPIDEAGIRRSFRREERFALIGRRRDCGVGSRLMYKEIAGNIRMYN